MANISDYAQVSCAFQVMSELDVTLLSSRGLFVERAVDTPYVKDYDTLPGNRPTDWPVQFDTSIWQLFAAFSDDTRVGGAIAFPRPERTSEGTQTTELWDLRVSPDWRGRGVGWALFDAVTQWCGEHRYLALHIETQHINIAACRFYRAQACVLDAITPRAYPSLPHETRIVWRKDFWNRAWTAERAL